MKISPVRLLLVALTLCTGLPAQAAFITIDDSDIDTVTITAGDFEAGFSVNGTILTTGLGNSGSITLADGILYSFAGSWIDLGLSPTDAVTQLFGINDDAFSGVQILGTTDGLFGSLEGQFNGFDPFVLGPFPNPGGLPVNPQGSSAPFFYPFMSGTFISEPATVPEPVTLALVGLGLAGFGFMRRPTK